MPRPGRHDCKTGSPCPICGMVGNSAQPASRSSPSEFDLKFLDILGLKFCRGDPFLHL
jgi:hypothetical protein